MQRHNATVSAVTPPSNDGSVVPTAKLLRSCEDATKLRPDQLATVLGLTLKRYLVYQAGQGELNRFGRALIALVTTAAAACNLAREGKQIHLCLCLSWVPVDDPTFTWGKAIAELQNALGETEKGMLNQLHKVLPHRIPPLTKRSYRQWRRDEIQIPLDVLRALGTIAQREKQTFPEYGPQVRGILRQGRKGALARTTAGAPHGSSARQGSTPLQKLQRGGRAGGEPAQLLRPSNMLGTARVRDIRRGSKPAGDLLRGTMTRCELTEENLAAAFDVPVAKLRSWLAGTSWPNAFGHTLIELLIESEHAVRLARQGKAIQRLLKLGVEVAVDDPTFRWGFALRALQETGGSISNFRIAAEIMKVLGKNARRTYKEDDVQFWRRDQRPIPLEVIITLGGIARTVKHRFPQVPSWGRSASVRKKKLGSKKK